MKTIKYFVMVITAAFLFAGCGGSQVKVPAGMNKPTTLHISKEGNVYIFYLWEDVGGFRENKINIEKFGKNFNGIANYGLASGYSYMAMVNENFNNLSGYPINSWKAMYKLMNLPNENNHYNSGFYRYMLAANQPRFKVVFLKERPKGLFVWDLKQLKADTDKYSK